ncbi:hypothetical protein Tco_0182380 [Tanacetum coccineum]
MISFFEYIAWIQEPGQKGQNNNPLVRTILCMVSFDIAAQGAFGYYRSRHLVDVGIVGGLSAAGTEEKDKGLPNSFNNRLGWFIGLNFLFAFSISLALALVEVDKTTLGSLTADVAADTRGVGSGYVNNNSLAYDLKVDGIARRKTQFSWLLPND